MTDTLLTYDEIDFLDMVQHIWRRGWPLESASLPTDEPPIRLALKACILERMAEIWSLPPKDTIEKTAAWCKNIPALTERFNVITPSEQRFWKNEPGNPIFQKRNIYAPMEFMFFL